jgi:predicted regulator of Ras-like GTPase activity (Roadblock/LC7/MglB family)
MVVITRKRFTDLLELIVQNNPNIESSAIIMKEGTLIESKFHYSGRNTSLVDSCIVLISVSERILSECHRGRMMDVRICEEKKDVVIDTLNEHGLLLSIFRKEK